MISYTLLISKIWQHLTLVLTATILACVIGIPLGILVQRYVRLRCYMLAVVNIFQTIPSLALLAILIPMLGIGFKPTIVTLALYALLPIVRNTFIGIQGVPASSLEAAQALGFTNWQTLRLIELPLALPVMMGGIRTATAITVGITTIAAFIGAGGLGDFITEGLALNNNQLILWGAIPTALLALILDYILAQNEILLSQRRRQQLRFKKYKVGLLGLMVLILFGSATHAIYQSYLQHQRQTIIIGSKNFTEQLKIGRASCRERV